MRRGVNVQRRPPSARSLPPCDDSRPEKQLRRHFHLIDANHGLISDITAITTALDSPTCTFTIPGRRLRDCGHSLDAWSVRTSFFIARTDPMPSFVYLDESKHIYLDNVAVVICNGAQLSLYAQRPALTFVTPLTFLPVLLNHT